MAVECVRKFSGVCSKLTGRDLDHVEKLCEVSCRFLRENAEQFVCERRDKPILVLYGNDATPAQTMETVRCESNGFTKTFYRRGRHSKDFLAEKLFITDGVSTAVVFTDPLELSDKTAWTAFEVSRRLFSLPRQLGHVGLTVLVHVYDSALYAPLIKRQRQRVEAVLLQEGHRRDWAPGFATLMSLLTWLAAAPCINHSVHNAMKWSVKEYVQDKSCMRSAFIVIASLRNGFVTLTANVSAWVRATLKFEDWGSSARVLPEVWMLLLRDSELIAALSLMQLRFEEGCLKVARLYEDVHDVVNQVVTILMKLWLFQNFTDSRWCTLGPVSRTMVACFLLGLDHCVSYIMSLEKVSKFYISGFPVHCTAQVKRLFAIVSISSHVPDAILFLLLKDDRVAMQLDEIDAQIQKMLDLVHRVSPEAWRIVGEVARMDPQSLCEASTSAALASAAHINQALLHARGPPWNLARGDVDENLAALEILSDPPAEEVSHKIWKLVKSGWSRDELKSGLHLLLSAPWSSTPVEQAHSATQCVMRRHRAYGGRTLRARVMLNMMRVLIRPSQHDAKLKKLVGQLEGLQRKVQRRISGRQAFVSKVNVKLQAQAGSKTDKNAMRIKVFKHHGKAWQGMEHTSRLKFEVVAQKLYKQKIEDITTKKRTLAASICAFRRGAEETAVKSGVRLLMSSCRLTPNQLSELERIWSSVEFSQARVEELRQEHLRPVGPPPLTMQHVINQMELCAQVPKPPKPGWLAFVCKHREWVKGTVIMVETGHDVRYLKLLHALQSPYLAIFAPLDKLVSARPDIAPVNWDASWVDTWRHEYVLVRQSYLLTSAGDVPASWSSPLFSCGALFLHGGRVVSNSPFFTLDESMDIVGCTGLPADTLDEEDVSISEPTVGRTWADDPAYLDFLLEGPTTERGPSPASPVDGGDDFDVDVFAAFDATCIDAVAEESDASQCELFRWAQKTGTYESWNSGDLFELLKIQAVMPLDEWLRVRGLARSQSFGIAVFDVRTITTMIESWCHKMRFLYLQADGVALHDELFGTDALADYTESEATGVAFRHGTDAVRRRITMIRDMVPMLPV
jgi:hypothetical protein